MDGWINYYLGQCEVQPNSTHHLLVKAIDPELSNPKLSVQKVADMLNVSRRQLYRDIHTLLEKPVAQWVRELRLYKAQWLVKQNRAKNLSELALRVGFRNTPYFRRIYRDFFGSDLSVHFSPSATQLTKKLNDR